MRKGQKDKKERVDTLTLTEDNCGNKDKINTKTKILKLFLETVQCFELNYNVCMLTSTMLTCRCLAGIMFTVFSILVLGVVWLLFCLVQCSVNW